MTLHDARSQLLLALYDQPAITKDDFALLQLDEALEQYRDGIGRAVCGDLVASGILRSVGEDVWVLAAPIGSVRQDVSISFPVATGVADTINTFLDANDIDSERVDAFNIHEGHIIALLDILADVLNTDPGTKP